MSNYLQGITYTLMLVLAAVPAYSQTTTFKIATLAPEGSDWMTQMKSGAAEISQRTEGRVKFKFYGGGVMGNDKKVLRKMRNGQLQGGAFTSGSLAERFPDMNLYGLPFLFDNLEEVDVVRKDFDAAMIKGLRAAGLVSFGFASGGFAQIMSNKPVSNVDDLKGKRVWVPEGDLISYAAMERFGLSPVTLPATDVLTGLQTGLIDVIGSSAIGALVLQWHTKVSHVSTMPVSYLFGLMAIEEKFFKRLSATDQKIVEDVFVPMYARMEVTNNLDNAKAMTALQGSGLELVPAQEGLLASLKAESRELWYELAKGPTVDLEKLQAIEAVLIAHRSAVSAGAP